MKTGICLHLWIPAQQTAGMTSYVALLMTALVILSLSGRILNKKAVNIQKDKNNEHVDIDHIEYEGVAGPSLSYKVRSAEGESQRYPEQRKDDEGRMNYTSY